MSSRGSSFLISPELATTNRRLSFGRTLAPSFCLSASPRKHAKGEEAGLLSSAHCRSDRKVCNFNSSPKLGQDEEFCCLVSLLSEVRCQKSDATLVDSLAVATLRFVLIQPGLTHGPVYLSTVFPYSPYTGMV